MHKIKYAGIISTVFKALFWKIPEPSPYRRWVFPLQGPMGLTDCHLSAPSLRYLGRALASHFGGFNQQMLKTLSGIFIIVIFAIGPSGVIYLGPSFPRNSFFLFDLILET